MTKIDRGPKASSALMWHAFNNWHAICDRAEAAEARVAELEAERLRLLKAWESGYEGPLDEALAARYRKALEGMAELVRAMDFDAHRTDVAEAIAANVAEVLR